MESNEHSQNDVVLRVLLLLRPESPSDAATDAPSGDSCRGAPTVAIKRQEAPVRSADDDEDDDSDPDDEDDKNDKQEIVAPKRDPEWLVHEATRSCSSRLPKRKTSKSSRNTARSQ
jgi:hypothetical protein